MAPPALAAALPKALQEGDKAALKMGKGVKMANFEGLWALGRLKESFPSPDSREAHQPRWAVK